MEASALQAPAALARSRLAIGAPLLRLRSDEQLVALFRAGHEEAFRVIHDRYRQRLFAYTRQMLPGSRQDAEDALQDIFVRAYSGLRASDRSLALRAWLYRVAHNRCIDELRRPSPPPAEVIDLVRPPAHDPIAEAERRESLRQLIADVRRLPEQQRSALLLRELGGMTYAELSDTLRVSVPAVKSLLVRARIGLAQALEAREAACWDIRAELVGAHDRGVRPGAIAKRHMHDCAPCRDFRRRMRGTSRQLAGLVPLGPIGLITKLLGFGGGAAGGAAGGGAAGGSAAGGSAAAAGGVAGTTGAVASIGAVAGGTATHVATIIAAAAVVTAGGAVDIQHSLASAPRPAAHHQLLQTDQDPAAQMEAVGSSTRSSAPAAGARPTGATIRSASTPTAASQGTTAGDNTAGPAIPAIDQTNPAANAATAGTDAGSTGSVPPTDGSANGATTTGPQATSPPAAGGTGGNGSGSAAGGAAGTTTGTLTGDTGTTTGNGDTGSSTATGTGADSGTGSWTGTASTSGETHMTDEPTAPGAANGS